MPTSRKCIGGVWAPMNAGKKKSMSEVANNCMNENLLTLEDSRGNWSAEKGLRVPGLFCPCGLRFLGENYLERLPEPACCRRRIAHPRVEEYFHVRLHRTGIFRSDQNRARPERRTRWRLKANSAGKAGGSREAAASISVKAAALGQSQQSFGSSLSPPRTL